MRCITGRPGRIAYRRARPHATRPVQAGSLGEQPVRFEPAQLGGQLSMSTQAISGNYHVHRQPGARAAEHGPPPELSARTRRSGYEMDCWADPSQAALGSRPHHLQHGGPWPHMLVTGSSRVHRQLHSAQLLHVYVILQCGSVNTLLTSSYIFSSTIFTFADLYKIYTYILFLIVTFRILRAFVWGFWLVKTKFMPKCLCLMVMFLINDSLQNGAVTMTITSRVG